jgi:hypothetical protein
MRLQLLCAVFASALLPAARAIENVEAFSGSAYSLDDDRLVYHETDYMFRGAGGSERVALYRCPDGRPFARKYSRDDGDARMPDFDFADARTGYREGVRREAGARRAYVQRSRERPQQEAPLPQPAQGVIDTGFDVFLREHWQALLRGESIRFDFLVPSRRRFYAFKVSVLRHPPAPPPGSVTFRVSLGSWFAFLLPHIDVSYDRASRRLVRYEGLSNVRGLDGRNYRVRFEYPKIGVDHGLDAAAVAAVLEQPLAASCTPADTAASARGQATVPEVTSTRGARNPNP